VTCQRCGQRAGEIRYTEVAGGEVRKQVVCAECARELGFAPQDPPSGEASPPRGPSPAAKLYGVVSIEATLSGEGVEAAPGDDRRCPECGLTASAFHAQSLFGCPRCYETFEEGLDALLKRLHGAVAHRGRVPSGRRAGAEAEPGQLRRELDEAIRRQDYKQAARLRDRLRRRERESEGGAAS
jgi:protein arginine kinase activator